MRRVDAPRASRPAAADTHRIASATHAITTANVHRAVARTRELPVDYHIRTTERPGTTRQRLTLKRLNLIARDREIDIDWKAPGDPGSGEQRQHGQSDREKPRETRADRFSESGHWPRITCELGAPPKLHALTIQPVSLRDEISPGCCATLVALRVSNVKMAEPRLIMPTSQRLPVQRPKTTILRVTLACALVSSTLTGNLTAQGRGGAAATKPTPQAPVRAPAAGGAWAMPDASDLVERVIRRIVTQDKPAAVPIADYKLKAFGKEATLMAVRKYLGRDVELPPSVYASVSGWTDAVDKLPAPECAAADTTCVPASTVWLAVTKFERGDLPHEMNVWYTTSFSAKPHDQLITSRYSFCERWLRVGGTWRYDGFIRVTSGD